MRHPALLLAGALALSPAVPAGAAELVDGIAAQVGNRIVLVSEVQQLARPVEERMRAAGAPAAEIGKMRAEILERVIERRLLEQAVERAEVDATEAEIDEAIAAIAQENGIETEEVRTNVEAQGLSWEAYREEIAGEIQRQKLISGVVHSKIGVEEAEVRKLYEKRYADQPQSGDEVHLRHILVPFRGEGDQARACAQVEAARRRIAAGESFADVAREVSAVSPERGGDMGWLHLGSVARWMREAVQGLGPGELSEVIPARFGCNLLQVVDRRSYDPVSYEEARPQLYNEIWNERMTEEYSEFIEELRAQTYIERKGIFAEGAPSLTGPVYGDED